MFTYKPLSGFKHFFFFKPCDDSNWLSHFRAGVKSQAESSSSSSSSSSSLAEVAGCLWTFFQDSQSISDRCKTNRKRGTAAAARVKAQTFEDWRPLPIAWWEAPQLSGGPPVHWNLWTDCAARCTKIGCRLHQWCLRVRKYDTFWYIRSCSDSMYVTVIFCVQL